MCLLLTAGKLTLRRAVDVVAATGGVTNVDDKQFVSSRLHELEEQVASRSA